jgi:DNA-binding NarL/FixJ family response regulator
MSDQSLLPISILYVDDHSIVREAVAHFLSLQQDMMVVASVGTGEEALKLFRRQRPDVVIMDLELPGMSGLEAIRAIREDCPDARIVVLTMYRGDEDVYRAFEAGVMSYVLKDGICNELVEVVREVHRGKRVVSKSIQSVLEARTPDRVLTRRERDVMELIARGLRNREIAAALGISEETAHGHIKSVFTKLHVTDRTAAVAAAVRRGIVHLG